MAQDAGWADAHPMRYEEHVNGQRYWAGTLELWCGDLFDLRREDLGEVAAVYDCAALTALPAASRGHYVRQLSSLLGTGGADVVADHGIR